MAQAPRDAGPGPSGSAKLLFLRRTGQRGHRRGAALDGRGHVVEVTGADFLLMGDKGVSLIARREFRLLDLLDIVLHALTARIVICEIEHVEPHVVDTGEGDELVLVAHVRQFILELGEWESSRFFFQLNDGEQL